MTTDIHAHKLLDFIRETPMSRDALKEKVIQLYGENALFCTCQHSGFDLNAMLDFFVNAEKIIEKEGVWSINEIETCSH
jgi:probable metal-binding protein